MWLQVAATPTKNADLLAAMRGGGTLFGVVTELAFKVYDVANYHGGGIMLADDLNGTTLRLASLLFLYIACRPFICHVCQA